MTMIKFKDKQTGLSDKEIKLEILKVMTPYFINRNYTPDGLYNSINDGVFNKMFFKLKDDYIK